MRGDSPCLTALIASPKNADIGSGGPSGVTDLKEVDGLNDGHRERHQEEEDEPRDYTSADFTAWSNLRVKKKAGNAERASMVTTMQLEAVGRCGRRGENALVPGHLYRASTWAETEAVSSSRKELGRLGSFEHPLSQRGACVSYPIIMT